LPRLMTHNSTWRTSQNELQSLMVALPISGFPAKQHAEMGNQTDGLRIRELTLLRPRLAMVFLMSTCTHTFSQNGKALILHRCQWLPMQKLEFSQGDGESHRLPLSCCSGLQGWSGRRFRKLALGAWMAKGWLGVCCILESSKRRLWISHFYVITPSCCGPCRFFVVSHGFCFCHGRP
jgi:hypothetical protein